MYYRFLLSSEKSNKVMPYFGCKYQQADHQKDSIFNEVNFASFAKFIIHAIYKSTNTRRLLSDVLSMFVTLLISMQGNTPYLKSLESEDTKLQEYLKSKLY